MCTEDYQSNDRLLSLLTNNEGGESMSEWDFRGILQGMKDLSAKVNLTFAESQA